MDRQGKRQIKGRIRGPHLILTTGPSCPALHRSHQVSERLYTGGLPDAIRLVQAGLAQPQDFNLVLGVSNWAPRQLEYELSQGMWHCVAASPDLVLPRRGECVEQCASS